MDQNIMPDNNFQQTSKHSKQISSLTGFTIIIVATVVLFGGAFAYLYFSTKVDKPVVQVQQTQNQNSQTAGWKTYTNAQYEITFKYPADSEINDVDIVGGRVLSLNINNIFVEIDIQNQMYGPGGVLVPAICNDDGGSNGPSTQIEINGVSFIKTDVSGDYSGMQSAAVAESFCVVHNSVRYRIVPRIQFSRYTVGGTEKGSAETLPNSGPDKNLSFQNFQKIVENMAFKFTTPVAGKGVDFNLKVAYDLMNGYLSQYKLASVAVNKRLIDYKINNIVVEKFDEINKCFFFTVDYSVQAVAKQTDWIAGNGEEGTNNWINNKNMFFNVVQGENNVYTIIGGGTGRGPGDCSIPVQSFTPFSLTI